MQAKNTMNNYKKISNIVSIVLVLFMIPLAILVMVDGDLSRIAPVLPFIPYIFAPIFIFLLVSRFANLKSELNTPSKYVIQDVSLLHFRVFTLFWKIFTVFISILVIMMIVGVIGFFIKSGLSGELLSNKNYTIAIAVTILATIFGVFMLVHRIRRPQINLELLIANDSPEKEKTQQQLQNIQQVIRIKNIDHDTTDLLLKTKTGEEYWYRAKTTPDHKITSLNKYN